MTAKLFTPIALGPVEIPNRIVVAPMCQYSAEDGCASDWHLQHWMNLAMSGAGLVVVEATAVERRGRITHGDVGLYSDANERAMGRALAAARAVALPGTRFGIQIAHAGRKASAQLPWEGGHALQADQDPWQTIAPSPVAFSERWPLPKEMDEADFARVKQGFVDASLRAARLGFDVIELHMAHGYLMHSIQSPLSNRRQDRYGRDGAGRTAFLYEVARAVRDAVPAHIPLGARITGTDWAEGGLGPEDAVALAGGLKDCGLAFACVSSGGLVSHQKIELKPGYQVPFADAVKKGTGIVTRAVGLIAGAHQAEHILQEGHADQIALARAILDDPRWGWHAADALGFDLPRPPQYVRAAKSLWPGASLKDK